MPSTSGRGASPGEKRHQDSSTSLHRGLLGELSALRIEMKNFTRRDFEVMSLTELMPPLCLHIDEVSSLRPRAKEKEKKKKKKDNHRRGGYLSS